MGWSQTVFQILQAGNVIINATGEFRYSGTPAAGNLVYSNTSSAGTDNFGNNYLNGLCFYDTTNLLAWQLDNIGVVQNLFTMTANPGATFTSTLGSVEFAQATGASDWGVELSDYILLGNVNNIFAPSTGLAEFCDANGILSYYNGNDAKLYKAGKFTAQAAGGNVTAVEPSFANVVQQNVGIGTYAFDVNMPIVYGSTADHMQFKWGGTATISNGGGHSEFLESGGATTFGPSLVYNGAASFATANDISANAGGLYCFTARGKMIFSASGTIILQGAVNASPASFDVSSNSTFSLERIA